MGREQRRRERRAQVGPVRRPVTHRPAGRLASRIPVAPLAIGGGVVGIALLLAYLILQSNAPKEALSAADRAAQDQSPDIPGTYVPFQGLGHLAAQFTTGRTPVPFCDGVPHSGSASESGTATPAAGATSTAVSGSHTTPTGTATPPTDCYLSNPPSSGRHLGVRRRADVGGGNLINIPPDPDVYPPDVEIPRDAIPHILEHSGVFVGYNCADNDDACAAIVKQLVDIANKRIDNDDDRLVLARDSDLPTGEIGLASITRFDRFPYTEFDKDRVTRFISRNVCRYDAEGFCK